MQARRAADRGGIPGLEPALDANPRRQRGCEQLKCFLDHGLNVYRHALTEPAAAEAENAINQSLCASRRVHDIIKIATQSAARYGMLVRELAIPQDRSEDVVEVM